MENSESINSNLGAETKPSFQELKAEAQKALSALRAEARAELGGAEQLVDRASEIAEESLDKVTSFVKKHPVECVVAGIGIGCLLGLWIRRK